jgi:MYXO-CTERM domain-containing protein
MTPTRSTALVRSASLGAFLVAALASGVVRATTYHVAINGSDNADGLTATTPWFTIGRAQRTVRAGDTVMVHGGTYAFTNANAPTLIGAELTTSGTAAAMITYAAVAGEPVPVINLSNVTATGRVTGLDVHCNFVHIIGLEVMGVHQFMSGQDSWGVRIQGSNNILERLNIHNNDAPGLFITSGANNTILNTDSHNNYDVLEGGGSGDGFGCHSSGGNNVFNGCRSYDNSDDGYDFINAAGPCIVQNSFSFRNGFIPGTTTTAGNGAGFKAGGYGSPPVVPATGAATHTVENCVASGNRSEGFYANHHPGTINFYNNTAFNNPANFNMQADAGFPSSHVIRNNIAMAPGSSISNLSGGTDTFNSWTLSVTVSAADFMSMDINNLALAPRNADGSLPSNAFVRLVAGSDLIDKGTNVGLPFVGAAPDLGAFEFGATTGSGGATGGGGATGAAGMTGGGAGGMTGAGGARAGTGGMTGGSAGGTTGGGAGGTTGGGAGGTTGGGAGGSTVTGAGGSTSGSAGGSTVTGAGGSSGGAAGAPGGENNGASGGCACALASKGSAAAGSLWLALLALVALRGRRRR